jgi:hypothetical protein
MEILGPIDAILLASPNGKFQVKLAVGDDGSLRAALFVRGENDNYEPPQGVGQAGLAIVRRGPGQAIIQFAPPG